jgi:hypothetical protein
MCVQYRFICLIPSMHKFTVRSRFLLNVFLFFSFILRITVVFPKFFNPQKNVTLRDFTAKKGGRGFLSSQVPDYEITPSSPKILQSLALHHSMRSNTVHLSH